MTVDPVDELKLLREVIAAAVNHLAAGGHIVRNDQLFKDLRKVHRATRDLQKSIAPSDTAEHWRNIACNMAFYAGTVLDQLHGPWNVVLSSFLDQGATEMTALARALAHQLGIELRESSDGGRTWYPIGAVEAELKAARDSELVGELEARGYRYAADVRTGSLRKVRDMFGREYTPFAGPPPARPARTLLEHLEAERTSPGVAAAIERLAAQEPADLASEAALDAIDVDATIEAYAHALGVPGGLVTRPCPPHVFVGSPRRCTRCGYYEGATTVGTPVVHRDYWEHRCDAGDRLINLDRGVQCDRCGEQDPVFMRSSAPAVK